MTEEIKEVENIEELQPVDDPIEPIKIFDNNGNFKYLLEFDRDTVKFAETRGIKAQAVENGNLGMIEIEELFFCAFRKHQKKLSKADTDKILDKIGGITPAMLLRLCQLFLLPYTELLVTDGDNEKNATLTVKF